MNFQPMYDCIVVDRLDGENRTTSGFIIPDMSVAKANRGVVLALGPGKVSKKGVMIPIDGVNVGDTVMFEGNGINVKVDSKEYVILKEQEIIAIVEA